ncbi:hypothetical protein FIBSPDRAFT_537361 [Athelia psychrophila]|uniref:Uncharacterized protein n=1 Tax=Athelia psychrophila TaxID=1759441 RepID=A0A166J7E8_9AGAM|nr:hypothetical protein FIBSPDRAFT_537361 [Fibularhizoctonia sp. CBS 109695]
MPTLTSRDIAGNAPPRTRAGILALALAKCGSWEPRIKTRFLNCIPHPSPTTRATRSPYDRSRPTQSLGKMIWPRSSNSRRQSPRSTGR